jgi:glucose/mannose-6-phosphate isomerase
LADIEDVEQVRALDPANMYNAIFDLPEHMTEAARIASMWRVQPTDFADPRNVVVIGMGGSAIGGEMVLSTMSSKLLVPFQVCRHYELPEYVDDETLLIVLSYSGNTEETIAAIEDGLARKAMIAAITTGGLLKDICALNEVPMCQIPSGLQPRAAIGYSFVPLMLFLEKIGLVAGFNDELKTLIPALQKFREVFIEDLPIEQNPAKKLATKLIGKIPIIYSGPTLSAAAGSRFKTQICENGKQLAFTNQFSEFNHNELVGWCESIEPYKDLLSVIILRDAEDMPQIRNRMNIVRDRIKGLGVDLTEVHSKGTTRMERLFSMFQLADFTSYYLAVLGDNDPTPVEAIEDLKKQLGGRLMAGT